MAPFRGISSVYTTTISCGVIDDLLEVVLLCLYLLELLSK